MSTRTSPYEMVPLNVLVPRHLRDALRKAADEAGERRDHAIVRRLETSLAVDAAKRMGRRG